MLLVPRVNEWGWQLGSHEGTRPAAAYGTTMTASATVNTKGNYAGVITTPIAQDAWGILINFNSVAVSASNRQMLVDIAVDPAGGTAYSDILPNLSACNASPYNNGQGGIWYYFPFFVKAGSTFAARCQSAVANATGRVNLQLYGQPSEPELVPTISEVRAIGEATATSEGTVVTPGTTSEGAWTNIGSPGKPSWWWQIGLSTSATTVNSSAIHADMSLGDATNKRIIILNEQSTSTTTEQTTRFLKPFHEYCGYGQTTDNVYIRLQTSGTADTDTTAIVYAGR